MDESGLVGLQDVGLLFDRLLQVDVSVFPEPPRLGRHMLVYLRVKQKLLILLIVMLPDEYQGFILLLLVPLVGFHTLQEIFP